MMQYPQYGPAGWAQAPPAKPFLKRRWKYIVVAIAIIAFVAVAVPVIISIPVAPVIVGSEQDVALLAGDISTEISEINNTLTILELAIT